MTSTRGPWLGFLLAGLCIATAPFGFPAARAQGFGPDPFKPFNSQFDQFVYPTSPDVGAPPGRGSGRIDNQFQQWLNEQAGADRALNQRYGIGVEYWKLRSDVERDKRARLNRRTGRQNEDTLASISQKYLAYFSEENPSKRAILMREFAPAKSQAARDGLARGEDEDGPPRPELVAGRRPRSGVSGVPSSGGRSKSSSLRDSAKSKDEATGRSIPPAPPIGRFSGGTSRTQRRPSDVLDRARTLDDNIPESRMPSATKRRNRDQPAPPPVDE